MFFLANTLKARHIHWRKGHFYWFLSLLIYKLIFISSWVWNNKRRGKGRGWGTAVELSHLISKNVLREWNHSRSCGGTTRITYIFTVCCKVRGGHVFNVVIKIFTCQEFKSWTLIFCAIRWKAKRSKDGSETGDNKAICRSVGETTNIFLLDLE